VRPCTGRTAQSWIRGIAVQFLDHGTRRGWGVSATPRTFFTTGKDPVPIVQKAGWAPGLVWTDAENLVSTGIRSPDRPARSQSLYRLRHPANGRVHRYLKFYNRPTQEVASGNRGPGVYSRCSRFESLLNGRAGLPQSVHSWLATTWSKKLLVPAG